MKMALSGPDFNPEPESAFLLPKKLIDLFAGAGGLQFHANPHDISMTAHRNCPISAHFRTAFDALNVIEVIEAAFAYPSI